MAHREILQRVAIHVGGMAAMLVGLQPILTVAWRTFGERVAPRQWLCSHWPWQVAGSWSGTRYPDQRRQGALPSERARRYQRRHARSAISHVDLCSAFIQFFGCAIAYAPLVLVFERSAPIQWTPGFVFALGWLVVVLSVGAISLLYWLLRHGAASNVAGLFFLVPAATAVMAWFLFDERLDAVAVAGMVLISVGVALARQMRDPVAP